MHNITVTDVRSVPGDSAFLLDDGRTSILYDTGFAFTGYAVAEKIKEVLGTRSLDYILLTHSHYDHALGSVYVKRVFPTVKVIAGEYAGAIFKKPTARAVMRDLDMKLAKKCGVEEYEDLTDELGLDIAVKDGDRIECGDMCFKVIGLPGHTRCSVGFYLEENKLLLGTETLGVYVGGDMVIPSYLIGYKITLESIEKAEKLELENILAPHYGLLSREETKMYLENGRKSAEETAEKMAEIFKSGGDEADAVAFFRDRFYNDYVKTIYPVDAMEMNTKIMAGLIRKELCEGV